jgi:hypothetical protein
VKSAFKVCLGDEISVPYIEKNLKWVLYSIQAEDDTPLLIADICLKKKGANVCYISLKLIENSV